jgi:hypothetical protein
MALIGAGLLAAVFLLPDLLPDDSELVPAPPPEVEEVEEREPPEAPAPPEHAEAPIVEPSPVLPAEPLPPLEASDGWVRVEAAGVSTKPAYEKWLEVDDLVRRFVAAVDEIALGQSPRAHVPFLRPSGPFRATDREGSLVTAPRSFRRYDALAEVVASVDAGLCAELYRRAAPLIGEAFADLGYPDVAFDERLREALALLLATPVPSAFSIRTRRSKGSTPRRSSSCAWAPRTYAACRRSCASSSRPSAQPSSCRTAGRASRRSPPARCGRACWS